ncbi:MAG: hypothetical protein B6D55_01995 [Candidatus Omnitrophica bacterium 4484_70.2]|nr:MAG: hypothetical protein B6D55_01995 [Candidatus Omnitrophica bacterium 4484_70.2]
MIKKIRGRLTSKKENGVCIEVGGIDYEINIPKAVYTKLDKRLGEEVELVIFQYFHMEGNRIVPVLVGFTEELEREFFEKFISVAGVGPQTALKALEKPVSLIAQAIEEGDIDFLKNLEGIGRQKAKHIVASLQGKVGRFALIREKEEKVKILSQVKEINEEVRRILKRLGYTSKEADLMIEEAWQSNPQITSSEELLNQIYYQRKK